MRAVIAIKSTGGQGASRATRYISERDRDPEREGARPRPLFSDREDTLTYRGSDRLLSNGIGTPDKRDLIHMAVSFRQEDYDRLGVTDDERKERLREVAREAMSEVKAELRAKEMRWVAGIHLNTNHPHVHILINKEVKDLVTDKPRRVGRIPKELLAYREAYAGGTRSVEGRIGRHFVTALDRQIERARESAERKIEPERGPGKVRELREWMRNGVKERDTSNSSILHQRGTGELQVRFDRLALGEALEMSLRLEYATLAHEKVLKHGETFRFRARDESVGGERQISESDVRRRAEARGARAASEQNLHTSAERQQIRKQESERDITRHSATIGELRKIRARLRDKLEKNVGRAELENMQAQARARSVREKYANRGQEAPSPIIARDKLQELQEQAVSLGLANHAEMLEQLRVNLSIENGQPSRNDKEAARLAAQLFIARTELQARQERLTGFDRTRHLQRWEIKGERWSLTDLDRQIEYQSDQARVIGTYRYHLDPRARKEASSEAARLMVIRDEIVTRINERRNELHKETEDAHKLVEVLIRINESEATNRAPDGLAMPQPQFTREELHRIESNAEVTRDAALLRLLDELESRLNERNHRSERITPQERLSRALAREVMAEVAHRESAERLAIFNERGEAQPLAIEGKDGRISVHRLKETRPSSVVERVLRPFIEGPDARETRHAIEAASANSQAQVVADYEKGRTYLEAAREISSRLRADVREQGGDITHLMPAFTPKESINLEIYAERQADPQVRECYLSLARGEVALATPLHDMSGSRFMRDHTSESDHGRNGGQLHEYESQTRSTGRAR